MARPEANRKARIPVYIIEQNPLIAHSLRRTLRRHSNFQLFFQEETPRVQLSKGGRAAVFVVDMSTAHKPLGAYLKCLTSRFPDARFIVIGEDLSADDLCRLLSLGIQGFLPYREVVRRLGLAIKSVAKAHLWIAPEVLERFVRYSANSIRSKREARQTFTTREKVIMGLLQRRLSNKEVSSALGIKERTVKFHLGNIFVKLGVHDRRSVVELTTARNLSQAVEAGSQI